MSALFTNGATTSLASNILSTETTLVVATNTGSKFPSITGSDYFTITLEKSGVVEHMKCTARTGDTLTVVRGVDGSTPVDWNAGDPVELRLISMVLDNFAQVDSPVAFQDDVSVAGTLTVTGAASLSSTLTVSAATSLGGTLTVTGATSVSDLTASGTITGTLSGTASNADALDNLDSTQFLRSDVTDHKTAGDLIFYDNVKLALGTSSDCYFSWTGSALGLESATTHIFDIIQNGSLRFRFDGAPGDFHAAGDVIAVSNFTSSDPALKDNITTLTGAVDRIRALRGVGFTWKSNDRPSYGVLSTDVREVLPDAVNRIAGINGSHDVVNYNAIIALLVEAVKELADGYAAA